VPAVRGSVGIRVGNAESVQRFAMRRDRSRVRPAMVHRLAQHRLRDHHLPVRRHVAVGERMGTNDDLRDCQYLVCDSGDLRVAVPPEQPRIA